VFVTTFAPTTFPYLLNIAFKSVARVSEDNPETHKLRFNEADDEVSVVFGGEGAVIFVLVVLDD
jgi:hypothetical protein